MSVLCAMLLCTCNSGLLYVDVCECVYMCMCVCCVLCCCVRVAAVVCM